MDDLRDHIRKLREDFTRDALSEKEVAADPAEQFRAWMSQAVESRVPEVQAMHLSTVSSDGKPSGRIVYLREFGNNDYCFYTNYRSRKADDLSQNAHASATFFWPQLERQVRIEGTVSRLPAERSDAYFSLRPYDSKIGAWASDQSQPLGSRDALEEKVKAMKKKFPGEVNRPEFWGGLCLKATYYEFWQGRPSRLHDRICYQQSGDVWKIVRLYP